MHTKKLMLVFLMLWLTALSQPVNAQTVPEEARPHMALTVPEIIDILVSLSDRQSWQVTGNCSQYLIKFKDIYPKKDGQVSVQTGFFLFGKPERMHKSEYIEGPVLEYRFFANTCPPGEHQRDYDCFGEAAITVEVISKNLVKSRQKPLRRDPNNYIPAGERSCTFQKK